MPSRSRLGISAGLALAVAACSSTPRVATTSAPAPRPPLSDWPVKVGNPYEVGGIWYYPKDEPAYDTVGIASWYGPGFHGLATANGEPYDMASISAAHQTLPLPSYVEVTNLGNGRTLLVRVNDRGPFVGDRIIDLSRRTAELLGLDQAGTGRVRVRRVFPSEAEKQVLRAGREPPVRTVSVRDLPPLPARMVRTVAAPATATAPHSAVAPDPAAAPGGTHFVQVAAFSSAAGAASLVTALSGLGKAEIVPGADGLFRVRLGPLLSAQDAQSMLAKAQEAGYQDARIITADRIG